MSAIGVSLESNTALHVMSVVNPVAGNGTAPRAAEDVYNLVEADGELQLMFQMLDPIQTQPDPLASIQGIAGHIQVFAEAHPNTPLRIMAYGGDGTISEVIRGVLLYLFPNQDDLINLSAQEISQRMELSAITVGVVAMGSANDVGVMIGAPRGEVSESTDYLRDAITVPLNLGWLRFDDGTDEPIIFSHNASAGTTIAALFKETREGHGRKMHLKRKLIGLKHVLRPHPFQMHWHHSNGPKNEMPAREVMIHGTPLGDGINGFPGTPKQGLGVKLFPLANLWRILRIFMELRSRGSKALKGKVDLLGADQRLKNMEADWQAQLHFGQTMRFSFRDEAGKPVQVPVQIDGDYVRDSSGMTFRTLPPWPRMMVTKGSLLHSFRSLD